ncbi:MAG: hypothetical protein H6R26_515 [Proteobacteria bacterium]|nr:hypothetical protein [Pseudomonadota bacterium]
MTNEMLQNHDTKPVRLLVAIEKLIASKPMGMKVPMPPMPLAHHYFSAAGDCAFPSRQIRAGEDSFRMHACP